MARFYFLPEACRRVHEPPFLQLPSRVGVGFPPSFSRCGGNSPMKDDSHGRRLPRESSKSEIGQAPRLNGSDKAMQQLFRQLEVGRGAGMGSGHMLDARAADFR